MKNDNTNIRKFSFRELIFNNFLFFSLTLINFIFLFLIVLPIVQYIPDFNIPYFNISVSTKNIFDKNISIPLLVLLTTLSFNQSVFIIKKIFFKKNKENYLYPKELKKEISELNVELMIIRKMISDAKESYAKVKPSND